MSRPPCTAPAKHGGPCRAFALPGGEACRVHSPEYAAAVRADRVRGGRTAGKLRALKGRRAKLETPRALMRFVGDLAHDILDGTVQPDVGRTVAYCISIQRQLIEASDLEQRLSALEAQAAAEDPGKGRRWGA